MPPWLEHLSIRWRIVLLVATILLPVGAMLAWLLADDVHRARAEAEARVKTLADGAAADLDRVLRRAQRLLSQLAEQPLVQALDPARCDPLITQYARSDAEWSRIVVRDLQGRAVCASPAAPLASPDAADPLAADAPAPQPPRDSYATAVRARDGRWTTELRQPIHDASGRAIGAVTMTIDLLALNVQVLPPLPLNAVISVTDANRTVVFRSTEPERFIGAPPLNGSADPVKGRREGLLLNTGRDGVMRLFAFRTLDSVGWRIFASLPVADVFATYDAKLRGTVALGVGLILLSMLLAWRLSAAIVRPIRELAATAERVAKGSTIERARSGGPAEIATVATQFNRMLDAIGASDAARREADARYRTLVDWSPEALSVHVDGEVRFVNDACVLLMRARSAGELVGRATLSAIPPAQRRAVGRQIAAAVTHRAVIRAQEQVLATLDGGHVEVELFGAPIQFDGRRALLVSMHDIGARKRTETALARSEAQLRGIVGSATVAIVTADAAQTIVSANPAAVAMFGWDAEALIGMPLDRLVPERYRASHRLDVQRFGTVGYTTRHMGRQRDVMGLHKSGTEFPIDAAISHLEVDGAKLYTVILRDLTDGRRAEAALLESEARLQRLLMTLPEAVLVVRRNRIAFVNEAALRMFAAGEADLLSREPLGLIHPDSIEAVSAHAAALLGGVPATPPTRLKILRSDGSARLVEAAATVLGEHGEQEIVVVARDVSSLVEAREQLAGSNAELQRLIAAQDKVQEDERKRIARELHDDLQQTLGAIRMDLVAVAQRVDAAPPSVLRLLDEAAELAEAAIESTRRIVNDLRPQMLEDLGLVPALEVLADQFSRRTGIDCRVVEEDAGSRHAPMLPEVATCLYRVSQEALGNVAKHAGARWVRIVLRRDEHDRLILRVSDDGHGMVMGARRKPASFGLMGMQERVRAIGALLHIESAPGAGTSIQVVVPASGAVTALEPGAASAGAADALPHAPAANQMLPAVIDALDGRVAVLARDGRILLVNQAWRAFAELNGDPGLRSCGPGQNYLTVCRRSSLVDDYALRALEGLLAVTEGGDMSFALDYPCPTPAGVAWYRMHVASIDEACVLVTHTDLRRGPGDRRRTVERRPPDDRGGTRAA